jgi:hypothetical protein
MAQYPWGEAGTMLHDTKEPDAWQCEFLEWLGDEIKARAFDGKQAVRPIRGVVSSGHGIGKSVLGAFIVNFIMPTRPHAHGTVTSNTCTQLQTKTWASIQRWAKLSIFAPWFVVVSNRYYHRDYKDSWFCAPQSSKEQNSEAFAGQHAADSTSFYLMDEDSAISDTIHEVAEGGLTDGEPMVFLFGNPTRSQGAFHKVCFGAGREKWNPRIIDSRLCRYTNKELIGEWVEEYGEDSDFVRVRVRGLPPRASDLQFIPTDIVYAAQQREAFSLKDDPLVAGLDVARGGADNNVLRFRKGGDARSIPPIRVPGEQTRDTTRLITLAADVLGRTYGKDRVEMLFIDGTGIGGPICDQLKRLGFEDRIMEVQFGAESPDPKYANMRAFMWGKGRDWLRNRGAIDDAPVLETDLTGPGYFHDRQDRVVLESKEKMKARSLASPDDGDALMLTFAAPVEKKDDTGGLSLGGGLDDCGGAGSWMGA